ARRLAEEACQPQYGVHDEAVALLRSIDTEEFNQRRLQTMRKFDAAWSAFVRHDFTYASNMIGTIDTRLLDGGRQSKLRDMMATAEMQPGHRPGETREGTQVALTGGRDSGGPSVSPVGSEGKKSEDGRGAASATSHTAAVTPSEEPDMGLLQRTQAMRE